MERRKKLAGVFGGLGVLWIAGFHLLPHAGPKAHPSLLVLAQAPPFALAVPPLLAAMFVLILMRSRPALAGCFALVLGAASLGHPVPRLPSSPENRNREEIRVMSFNSHYRSRQMPRMLREIEAKQVDVVLLQEVRGNNGSALEQIKKAHPDWSFESAGDVAIASRWPIRNPRLVKQRSNTGRRMLLADIDGPQPLQAAVVHWSVPQFRKGADAIWRGARGQGRDVEDTLRLIGPALQSDRPLILGGDFNAQPHHPSLGALNGRMINCFLAAGSGFGWTFPSRRPLVQIDHLFVGGGLQPVRSWVGPDLGSDHRPILADIRLP